MTNGTRFSTQLRKTGLVICDIHADALLTPNSCHFLGDFSTAICTEPRCNRLALARSLLTSDMFSHAVVSPWQIHIA